MKLSIHQETALKQIARGTLPPTTKQTTLHRLRVEGLAASSCGRWTLTSAGSFLEKQLLRGKTFQRAGK